MALQESTGVSPGTSMSRETKNGNFHEPPPNKGLVTRVTIFRDKAELPHWTGNLDNQKCCQVRGESRIGGKRGDIINIHCIIRPSCSSRVCNLSH